MLLERLSNACGVSGREDEVRDLLKQELAPHVDEMWTDAIGNLIVRKGSGPVRVMLDAHMDEVGFCVGSITDEGYLKLKKIGGLDDRVLPGRQVWVTNRRLPAVLGAKAWHLTSAEERGKPVPFDQMYADMGCKNRQEVEELGIEPGDPVYFATHFERLSDKVVKGKALDDRAGCAIIAAVLQQFSHPGITLYGAFTCQEEVGLRGARIAAYNLNPDVAIALDATVCADVAGVDPVDTVTNLGQGPAVYMLDGSSVPNLRVMEELVRVAQQNGVRHQFRRIVGGGTDAGGIALQRSGIPVCPMSVPCRYFHTNAALVHLDDLNETVRLVHHFLESVEKGEFRP
jgi:endoglucanase